MYFLYPSKLIFHIFNYFLNKGNLRLFLATIQYLISRILLNIVLKPINLKIIQLVGVKSSDINFIKRNLLHSIIFKLATYNFHREYIWMSIIKLALKSQGKVVCNNFFNYLRVLLLHLYLDLFVII